MPRLWKVAHSLALLNEVAGSQQQESQAQRDRVRQRSVPFHLAENPALGRVLAEPAEQGGRQLEEAAAGGDETIPVEIEVAKEEPKFGFFAEMLKSALGKKQPGQGEEEEKEKK